jgi:predicted ATPase
MTSEAARHAGSRAAGSREDPPPPYITRVKLTNYRSIASCDVRLSALTFLVGPNGAGKSNFIDALAFVRDSLRTSLEHALRERSGIDAVRRRSNGHPHNFGVRLEFRLPGGESGHYAFQVGAAERGGYHIIREECVIDADAKRHSYAVRGGVLGESTLAVPPASYPDRLFLTNASGAYPFRVLYDALGSMGFYNLNPRLIRDLQTPDDGSLLAAAGENIASVLARMSTQAQERKVQVEELLRMIVPAIDGVDGVQIGPKETLEFRQSIEGAKHPWRFPAANMSDGTLRALGILVALFQPGGAGRVPLVGIEEPEVALHPAAAGLLMGALRKASLHRQVLITSHSPDLLDDPDLSEDEILGVASKGNASYISVPDAATRAVIRSGLYTPGELLRLDQVAPSFDLYERGPRQLDLFTGWRA